MSANSYADLLERVFSAYEDRHTLTVIEELATGCRTQLAGQTPPGTRLEMLERLLGGRCQTAVCGRPLMLQPR
jgi:hypothetical protein